MRQGLVYNNGRLAGIISEISASDFIFRYDDEYFADKDAPAVSLTLPKSRQVYHSSVLFSFFANMLSEGHNRTVQSRIHSLDRNDDFGILLATARTDTPGAITVMPL